MDQADTDEGHQGGPDRDERAELVPLRREKRVKEMEVTIRKRASAYFDWENILCGLGPADTFKERADQWCNHRCAVWEHGAADEMTFDPLADSR